MRNLIFLALLLPLFLIGQNYHERHLPILPNSNLDLIHVAEDGDNVKAFIIEKVMVESGRWAPTEEKNFPVNVLHVVDMNTELSTNHVMHVLDQYAFPKSYSYTIKRGRTNYGKSSEVKNYEQLLEMYPELSDVKYIDDENRLMPQSFYRSDLKTGALNDKIKGFEMTKFSQDYASVSEKEKPQKKKKKGLMGKLGGAIEATNKLQSKLDGRVEKFGKVESVGHDWEDAYNGGQDKKNHWKCRASASCATTGKVIAFNVYKKKGEDLSQEKTQEIVVFDANGEVIKKHEFNNEVPWEFYNKASLSLENPDQNVGLKSMSLILKPITGKRYKEGNKNQVRVVNITADGNIAYDHTYDLPHKAPAEFTMKITDDNKTIVQGRYNGEAGRFILESTPENQFQSDIIFEGKERISDYMNILSNGNENYLILREDKGLGKEARLKIYPFNNGTIGDKIEITADTKGSTRTEFDILYFEDNEFMIQSKEVVPGINGFNKYPPVVMHHYKIADSMATKLNNHEKQPLYLIEYDMDNYDRFVKIGDKYYFISANFFPSKDNPDKLLIGRKLTSMEL